jgi:hypothetical protein
MFLHAKAALLMRTSETQFPVIPHHIISLWHDYKEGRRVFLSFLRQSKLLLSVTG